MQILIVSQYFWPETFRCNDIALELIKRGHTVTVLTGKPNYPKGKIFKGYGFLRHRKEEYKGIKIIRVPIIPRGTGSSLRLLLNYSSFMVFACIAAIFRVKGKFDAIFVHQPSPITSAIPAIILKKTKKCPVFLWVLDIWPESVQATANINNKTILKAITSIVRFVYRNSDKILISSKGFKASINSNLDINKEIVYFPNWAEDVFLDKPKEACNLPRIELSKGFNIMFAGNIGEAQDFETILAAIIDTKNDPINWIFIGDGRKRKWFELQVKKLSLTNVLLIGNHPIETMPYFFAQADAMLVTLKNEEIFSLTVPAKIQAYLASSKVILGMLNGESANIIKESKSGFACEAGNAKSLANTARKISMQSSIELQRMEQNAKEYYSNNFKKNYLIDKLEEILHNK